MSEPLVGSNSDRVLAAMPGSRAWIRVATHLSAAIVHRHVERLHSAKLCHIKGYRAPEGGRGGRWVPVYEAGAGVDAPRPSMTASAVATKRSRIKAALKVNPNAKVRLPGWTFLEREGEMVVVGPLDSVGGMHTRSDAGPLSERLLHALALAIINERRGQ